MVKSNKKCNKELVARVKVMINEDARISSEETASALNISSPSAYNILLNRLGYCKICVR